MRREQKSRGKVGIASGWRPEASHLYLELMVSFHLLPERSRERQQAALVHMETAVLVPADNVEGERRAIPWGVFVPHHQLEDAAADRLALLRDTFLFSFVLLTNRSSFLGCSRYPSTTELQHRPQSSH